MGARFIGWRPISASFARMPRRVRMIWSLPPYEIRAIVVRFTRCSQPPCANGRSVHWMASDLSIVRAYAASRSDDLVAAAVRDPGNRRAVHALLAAALREWALGSLDGVRSQHRSRVCRVAFG